MNKLQAIAYFRDIVIPLISKNTFFFYTVFITLLSIDIPYLGCYDTENTKKKGVRFMLNMVKFENKYGRSLAPWVSLG